MENMLIKDGLVIEVETVMFMKDNHIIERGDDSWI